jgi:hypothetical protein
MNIIALAFALGTFPSIDVAAEIEHPSPAAIAVVAVDFARFPSKDPIAEAQPHLSRGVRRR